MCGLNNVHLHKSQPELVFLAELLCSSFSWSSILKTLAVGETLLEKRWCNLIPQHPSITS